ncbi:urease-associated protein [Chryseobacterium sp. StRB126]|nr:urease-associated protein [Chryseobacterium sp. StRB126]
MICTFECTFCKDCVDYIFKNVCPNCGGGLEKRPIRPKSLLAKYPVSAEVVYKPINEAEFTMKQEGLIDIPLGER